MQQGSLCGVIRWGPSTWASVFQPPPVTRCLMSKQVETCRVPGHGQTQTLGVLKSCTCQSPCRAQYQVLQNFGTPLTLCGHVPFTTTSKLSPCDKDQILPCRYTYGLTLLCPSLRDVQTVIMSGIIKRKLCVAYLFNTHLLALVQLQ